MTQHRRLFLKMIHHCSLGVCEERSEDVSLCGVCVYEQACHVALKFVCYCTNKPKYKHKHLGQIAISKF